MATDAIRAAAITVSVLLFALLLKTAGLALSTFMVVWVATRAGEIPQRTALVLAAALAVVLTLAFSVGLRLHMPALPTMFN